MDDWYQVTGNQINKAGGIDITPYEISNKFPGGGLLSFHKSSIFNNGPKCLQTTQLGSNKIQQFSK